MKGVILAGGSVSEAGWFLLDVSATGEENIIETDSGKEMRDLEYRKKQLERLSERGCGLRGYFGRYIDNRPDL